MNDLIIRPSVKSDFGQLVELNNIIWNDENTPQPIYWESEDDYSKHCPAGSQFVAIINDKVAGYVGFKRPTKLKSNNHVLEIIIGVDPSFQGKGIGKALLDHIFEWSKDNGTTKLSLRVLSTNAGAISFYLKNGFKEQGRLINEFKIGGEFVDDILMYKELFN
ncbi:GNAT family N-acetyltransferase [Paenibacillus harenae]|uniref:GNAT family N-acetyltransferase n=1 Tax=Paenibacillus harenae TaxID=306543 RepID=UPI00041E9402|nr:GNAT family N-acetyltransferase [Paenibacillus harenae]